MIHAAAAPVAAGIAQALPSRADISTWQARDITNWCLHFPPAHAALRQLQVQPRSRWDASTVKTLCTDPHCATALCDDERKLKRRHWW